MKSNIPQGKGGHTRDVSVRSQRVHEMRDEERMELPEYYRGLVPAGNLHRLARQHRASYRHLYNRVSATSDLDN